MRRFTLIVLVLFSCLSSFSQLTKDKTYTIKLYDGREFSGKSISYEQPILEETCFKLDTMTFSSNEVAFFKNDHGNFANLFHLKGKGENYAMRTKKGKVSIYEKIDMEIYGAQSLEVSSAAAQSEFNRDLATGRKMHFYHIEGTEVQKAKYRNLMSAIGSNDISKKWLKKYRTYQILQVSLIAAGVGIIAGDQASHISEQSVVAPVSIVGLAVAGSSFFVKFAKDDFLWNAVDAFNK